MKAEIGKWYKGEGEYLVYVKEILGNHNYVLVAGFDSKGHWGEEWDTVVTQKCMEVTKEDVDRYELNKLIFEDE